MTSAPVSPIGDGGLSGAELSLFNSGTPGRVPSAIVGRNGFPGPGVHNFDARVARDFPIHEKISLQLYVEAYNLTNHKNILSVSTGLYNYLAPGAAASTTPSGTVTCGAALRDRVASRRFRPVPLRLARRPQPAPCSMARASCRLLASLFF